MINAEVGTYQGSVRTTAPLCVKPSGGERVSNLFDWWRRSGSAGSGQPEAAPQPTGMTPDKAGHRRRSTCRELAGESRCHRPRRESSRGPAPTTSPSVPSLMIQGVARAAPGSAPWRPGHRVPEESDDVEHTPDVSCSIDYRERLPVRVRGIEANHQGIQGFRSRESQLQPGRRSDRVRRAPTRRPAVRW